MMPFEGSQTYNDTTRIRQCKNVPTFFTSTCPWSSAGLMYLITSAILRGTSSTTHCKRGKPTRMYRGTIRNTFRTALGGYGAPSDSHPRHPAPVRSTVFQSRPARGTLTETVPYPTLGAACGRGASGTERPWPSAPAGGCRTPVSPLRWWAPWRAGGGGRRSFCLWLRWSGGRPPRQRRSRTTACCQRRPEATSCATRPKWTESCR